MDRSQLKPQAAAEDFREAWIGQALHAYDDGGARSFWRWLQPKMPELSWDETAWGIEWLGGFAREGDDEWRFSLRSLTLMRDRRYDSGTKKRASLITLIDEGLQTVFRLPARFGSNGSALEHARRMAWADRKLLSGPQDPDDLLVIDAAGFPPEGEQAAARWLVRAHQMGWRRFLVHNWRGGRFAGCGLGADSQGVRVDLYGDPGDYAASGLDGAEIHLHGDGQDQLGQILKRGKLVVHGDVGQTFLYGAKGGEIYVLGSAAGRPLINAVGRPRAVINGTCLDYLAESFMAGDPHQGGGFVVLNGVTFDEAGAPVDLESPYPGGNLFSLASGGAIYLRDPHRIVSEAQLNGGVFGELSEEDWRLIEPYLRENERLFGIRVEALLTVDGERRDPAAVYRRVEVRESGVLRQAG